MNKELIEKLNKIKYNEQHEFCSNCGSDDTIVNEFKVYYCVECGERLLPCSLCDLECEDCPFDWKADK